MEEQKREQQIKQIKIEYSTAPDYRVVAATGIWGGLTPQGALKMDFTLDSVGMPQSVVYDLTPEGRLGDELGKEPDTFVSRELQVGVLLSIAHAESIANWILEKVRDAKKIAKEEKKGEQA